MTLNYMEIFNQTGLGALLACFCYQCDRKGKPST